MVSVRKHKDFLALLLLAVANATLYNFIYMRTTFYTLIQSALGLTHEQLGMMWSVYGIVAMVSYLIGGWIADFIDPKKLIIFSFIGTVLLGCILAFIPSFPVLVVVFALFGIVSIMTFYPVGTKLTASIGTDMGRASSFSIASAIQAGSLCIITFLSVLLAEWLEYDPRLAFRALIILYVGLMLVMLIIFCSKSHLYDRYIEMSRSTSDPLLHIKKTISDKRVWLVGMILFSSYIVVSGSTYYTPYMNEILGISQSNVIWLNFLRGTILSIPFTVFTGWIADKYFSSKKIMIAYGAIGVVFLLILICLSNNVSLVVPIVACTFVTWLLVHGMRTISMASAVESGLSIRQMGSAAGLISFMGYAPDAFYYKVGGNVIDTHPENGYQMIFWTSAAALAVCCVFCFILQWTSEKKTDEE